MDSLRLLSRSTKLSKGSQKRTVQNTPSSGAQSQPQNVDGDGEHIKKKRKRVHDTSGPLPGSVNGPDFFGSTSGDVQAPKTVVRTDTGAAEVRSERSVAPLNAQLSEYEKVSILKQHKLKVTWLNPDGREVGDARNQRLGKATSKESSTVFPDPLQTFGELRGKYSMSKRLADNIDDQGYSLPTEVQLAALPLLLDTPSNYLPKSDTTSVAPEVDLLTVAPTGSGKTLAFMIPLVHRMLQRKHATPTHDRKTAAIVLAPTKELVGQIVNEGRKLCQGTGISIAQVKKGMSLVGSAKAGTATETSIAVKADILVSTPGLMQNMTSHADAGGLHALDAVRCLVLDEADVVLDPLFREHTLTIWNSLPSRELRVSLWSATMGSNIEELARHTIDERRANSTDEVSDAPLIRLIVGLKDSAVANVEHKLVYAATEQGKLMGLRQLLHPTTSLAEAGLSLRPPFLVFTQTIERAAALHSELLYDIPAEAGGISRIAVLHSELSDTARDTVMTRFRKGEVWVLITTDLLSRGIDFRGINGVVNYDIPTSSAAYVHRVGRTGRAGRTGGIAVTLYSKEDIPYLKHIANVVAISQRQMDAGDINGGVDKWLLDALPSLTKAEKQKLKKHGVETRTARSGDGDRKASRLARIGTKSGYERKLENNRKGAVLGSQRRVQADLDGDRDSDEEEGEFVGFD